MESGSPAPGLPRRYEVLRFLRRGGLGRVYLCRDTELGVEVAIKVFIAEVVADPESLHKIQKGATVAARFRDCPGILSLHALESSGETRYIVMEFAAGGSLSDRLWKGAHSESDCRRIGAEIADALAVAHGRGVLHLDLVPHNVMLDSEGHAKVDFFSARQLNPTRPRMLSGNPMYVAPEFLKGQEIDGRADLYSLGCMLFALATGKLPFRGGSMQMMFEKCGTPAVAPDPRELRPGLSAGLAGIVMRLMAPDPVSRFPDGAACAASLRAGNS